MKIIGNPVLIMEYLRLSWEDIQKQCESLARKIKEQNVAFDLIISIGRGGWVPARLLSDLLNNDDLYTIRIKFYDEIAKTKQKPMVVHPIQVDVAGKKVLLVDDIADSGGSLLAAVNHLIENGANSVYVVTLVKKPSSKLTPTLFELETPAWVIFPWEVRETIRDIQCSKKGADLKRELKRAKIRDEELAL